MVFSITVADPAFRHGGVLNLWHQLSNQIVYCHWTPKKEELVRFWEIRTSKMATDYYFKYNKKITKSCVLIWNGEIFQMKSKIGPPGILWK